MQNHTKKPAKKARRKSETLTLSPAAALAFNRWLDRWRENERAHYSVHRNKAGRDFQRRAIGSHLIEMACEALMEIQGPLHHGAAWWKFVLAQMSDEEMNAKNAMIAAQYKTIGGSLDPIDDATEAEAIRKLQAGKSE